MDETGMSQSDIARKMKVTRSLVSQYLSGHRCPGLDMVVRFADALGIEEPIELLSEVHEPVG